MRGLSGEKHNGTDLVVNFRENLRSPLVFLAYWMLRRGGGVSGIRGDVEIMEKVNQ